MLFAGDLAQLLVGIKRGINIRYLPDVLYSTDQSVFLCTMRLDIQAEHREAFARIVDIL